MVPAFAVAVLANLAAYLVSPHAVDVAGAREMAAVLPLGAVLAGRTLGGPLAAGLAARRGRAWLCPLLVAGAAACTAGLAYGATQPAVPPANQPLAGWLTAHGLSEGLAGYWEASSTTLDWGGRVVVSAVAWTARGTLGPYQWETDDSYYDPERHYANFFVAGGQFPLPAASAVTAVFGPPRHVYHVAGYTIMVWNTNLLTKLKGSIQ
jgi:hypothetical protein